MTKTPYAPRSMNLLVEILEEVVPEATPERSRMLNNCAFFAALSQQGFLRPMLMVLCWQSFNDEVERIVTQGRLDGETWPDTLQKILEGESPSHPLLQKRAREKSSSPLPWTLQ